MAVGLLEHFEVSVSSPVESDPHVRALVAALGPLTGTNTTISAHEFKEIADMAKSRFEDGLRGWVHHVLQTWRLPSATRALDRDSLVRTQWSNQKEMAPCVGRVTHVHYGRSGPIGYDVRYPNRLIERCIPAAHVLPCPSDRGTMA